MPLTTSTGLLTVWTALRRRWLVFLLVATAIVSGVSAWAIARPSEYAATSLVAMRPHGERPAAAPMVVLTAPRYVAYATSPFLLRQIARDAGLNASDLEAAVVVSMEVATANLSIVVTLRDAEAAARVANAVADAVAERARTDVVLTAQVLSEAEVPTAPSGPSRAGWIVVGLLLGVVLAAAASVGFDGWRRPGPSAARLSVAAAETPPPVQPPPARSAEPPRPRRSRGRTPLPSRSR